MSDQLHCPDCNSTAIEQRGQRRVYAALDDTGQIDGWDEGDVDWDTTEDGKDLLYCNECDQEWGRP